MEVPFDDISELIRKFTNINDLKDIPPHVFFRVLNHPDIVLPSQKDFINQVIAFFSTNTDDNNNDPKQAGSNDDYIMSYLPLLGYLNFSIATLDQLQSLKKIDKYCVYEGLDRYLKIRQNEDNYLRKVEYLRSAKASILNDSIESKFIIEWNESNKLKSDYSKLMSKREELKLEKIEFDINKSEKDFDKKLTNCHHEHLEKYGQKEPLEPAELIDFFKQKNDSILKAIDRKKEYIKELEEKLEEQKQMMESIKQVKVNKDNYLKIYDDSEKLKRKNEEFDSKLAGALSNKYARKTFDGINEDD